jgi:hypothetical protein
MKLVLYTSNISTTQCSECMYIAWFRKTYKKAQKRKNTQKAHGRHDKQQTRMRFGEGARKKLEGVVAFTCSVSGGRCLE